MGTLSLCINAFSQNVKSLSFGEPCSNIPLIKNQKKYEKNSIDTPTYFLSNHSKL